MFRITHRCLIQRVEPQPRRRQAALAVLSIALAANAARADLLTDAQLWLDPATLPYALYPRDVVQSAGGSISWQGSGGRRIIGANILPTLREGVWLQPGRVFKQSDYFYQPNIDYRADLTNATLTATFSHSGLYHVRTMFDDGKSETRAVLVNSAFAGHPGEVGPNKSGPSSKIGVPQADLYLVSGLPSAHGAMEDIAFGQLSRAALNVTWAPDPAGLVSKICAWSMALGRPISVAYYGHGAPGEVQIGAETLMGDQRRDTYSPSVFHHDVTGKVSSIYFFSCSLGDGIPGATFSNEVSGGDIMVYNWNRTMYVGGEQLWAVNSDATLRCIPAPGAATGLVAAVFALALRRRRSGAIGLVS